MRRPVVPICGGFVSGAAIAYFLIAKYDNEVVKCIYAVLITGIASAGAAGALKLRIALCRRKGARKCGFWKEFDGHAPVWRKFCFNAGISARIQSAMLYLKTTARVPIILFAAAFILSAALMHAENGRQGSLEKNVGSVCDIRGVVLRAEEKEMGERYKLLVRTDEGEKTLVTVSGGQFAGDSENCEDKLQGNKHNAEDASILPETRPLLRELVGCRISLRAYVEFPQGRRNPKCFDYRLYLKSRGVKTVVSAKAAQIKLEETPKTLGAKYLHKISEFKGGFSEKLMQNIDKKSAALLLGMLFGEKELIEDDTYTIYRQNGTAHVLAVSGLHVGALYACVSKLVRKRGSIAVNALMAAVLLTYAALAGFSPSVTRAAAMIFIHIIADMLHRRYDMLSAACLCIIINMVKNPFVLFDTGFQLSYTAVIAIAILGSAAKLMPYGGALSFLSVQLGTVPLTAYIFNYFSLGSFIVNIPVILIAGVTVPCGMLAFAVHNISNTLFVLAAQMASILCDFMTYINELAYMDGHLTFDTVSPGIALMIIYYSIVLGGFSEMALVWYARRSTRKIAAATVLIVLIGFAAGAFADDGFSKTGIVFVDVGQGDCLHIKSGSRHYLIDGGGSLSYDVGENTLKPYLLKNGVRKVEAAFVSHLHTDHYRGIASLCRRGMVRYLCTYEGNRSREKEILAETGLMPERIIYIKAGDRISLAGDGSVTVLSPASREDVTGYQENNDDENKNSLIMRVECGGISVLMNGDISAEAEMELVRKFTSKDGASAGLLECDILKAAHHGSKYSSCDEFVEAVQPEIMMFQVGSNNYGHPDKSLIEKCLKKGIMVYRNDTDGAVGFYRERRTNSIKALAVRKD